MAQTIYRMKHLEIHITDNYGEVDCSTRFASDELLWFSADLFRWPGDEEHKGAGWYALIPIHIYVHDEIQSAYQRIFRPDYSYQDDEGLYTIGFNGNVTDGQMALESWFECKLDRELEGYWLHPRWDRLDRLCVIFNVLGLTTSPTKWPTVKVLHIES